MNDERMHSSSDDERMHSSSDDERMLAAGMDDAFRARMRQGLSTMAVRERVRERARNRAIAGGALATVVVATAAVFGVQALGGAAERHDQAAPGVTQSPTVPPTAAPTPSATTSPEPTATAEPEPTPPPGFEGVAAGEPHVLGFDDCSNGCGDAGAAGEVTIEGEYDVYVLCEGSGQVHYGPNEWIDCRQADPGTGWATLGYRDVLGDGDPAFSVTEDFDGRLDVLPRGQSPRGAAGADTATVYFDCGFGQGPTVGGILFDCARDATIIPDLGAWGVPLAPGSYAPAMEIEVIGAGPTQVRWVLER